MNLVNFSKIFLTQFIVYKWKPPKVIDLFDIKQYPDETLKEYLNKFNNIIVRVLDPNEMFVIAFVKD